MKNEWKTEEKYSSDENEKKTVQKRDWSGHVHFDLMLRKKRKEKATKWMKKM